MPLTFYYGIPDGICIGTFSLNLFLNIQQSMYIHNIHYCCWLWIAIAGTYLYQQIGLFLRQIWVSLHSLLTHSVKLHNNLALPLFRHLNFCYFFFFLQLQSDSFFWLYIFSLLLKTGYLAGYFRNRENKFGE